MDRRSRATLVFRAGTLLVAIGLAFGLVSFMSGLTVSGFHADAGSCISYFGCTLTPAGTYTVLTSWNPANPQQMYFLNMTSSPEAEVYLLSVNQTAFNAWIASRSGLPLANVSSGPQELVWFSDYMASHEQQVAGKYDVSGTNVIVKYFVPDVEPLMVVLTNGNAKSSLNFTYIGTSKSVAINPSQGFQITGYLGTFGAVFAVLGMVLKRKLR